MLKDFHLVLNWTTDRNFRSFSVILVLDVNVLYTYLSRICSYMHLNWKYWRCYYNAACFVLGTCGIIQKLSSSACYFVNKVSSVRCGCADLNWQLRICVDVLQSFVSELALVFSWDSLSSCIQLGSGGCISHWLTSDSGFSSWMPQSSSLMASASVVDAVDGRPGMK